MPAAALLGSDRSAVESCKAARPAGCQRTPKVTQRGAGAGCARLESSIKSTAEEIRPLSWLVSSLQTSL